MALDGHFLRISLRGRLRPPIKKCVEIAKIGEEGAPGSAKIKPNVLAKARLRWARQGALRMLGRACGPAKGVRHGGRAAAGPAQRLRAGPGFKLGAGRAGPRRSWARKSGWAIEIRSSARSRRLLPCRLTAPYSVAIQWTCPRVVTTPAPGVSCPTMREMRPPAAVDGRVMMALPPCERAAPRTKSIWPPIPEYMRWPIESAQTCPVRSI